MSNPEILRLALEGAKEELRAAADCYSMTRGSEENTVERIRLALAEYDTIKKLIDSEKE